MVGCTHSTVMSAQTCYVGDNKISLKVQIYLQISLQRCSNWMQFRVTINFYFYFSNKVMELENIIV